MPKELADWFMEREDEILAPFGTADMEIDEDGTEIDGVFTYTEIVGLLDSAMDKSWMSVSESDRFMRHFNDAIWELYSSKEGEAMLRNLGKGKES